MSSLAMQNCVSRTTQIYKKLSVNSNVYNFLSFSHILFHIYIFLHITHIFLIFLLFSMLRYAMQPPTIQLNHLQWLLVVLLVSTISTVSD